MNINLYFQLCLSNFELSKGNRVLLKEGRVKTHNLKRVGTNHNDINGVMLHFVCYKCGTKICIIMKGI
jgi:hypothetical protein